MLSVRTALSLFRLMLISSLFVAHTEGQEATPRASILWQKELDSDIEQKWHIGLEEPDVGISTDSTRTFSIRMAATIESLYLFDGQGNIERRIPLRKRTKGPEKGPMYGNERATTAPNGQFYAIRTLLTPWVRGPFTNLRVFKDDGTFLFDLNNGEWPDDEKRRDGSPRWSSLWGTPFIAPNGEYMVVFHDGGGVVGPEEGPEPVFLNFYDMTGTLIKHISEKDFRQYDLILGSLGFSRDGSRVMLLGSNKKRDAQGKMTWRFEIMVFDAQGNLIRRIEGLRNKKLTVTRTAIKRLLEPERVTGRLQRGHATGLAEFRMLKDGKRGVYAKGQTLYLFELDNADVLVSTFHHEFQGLYSD